MPCLLGCLALSVPRLVLFVVWLFTDYIGQAYETKIWPFLGFFFLPLTTLAYAYAMHNGDGHVSGVYLVLVIVAAIFDLGLVRSGRSNIRPGGPRGPAGGGDGAGPREITVHGERVG